MRHGAGGRYTVVQYFRLRGYFRARPFKNVCVSSARGILNLITFSNPSGKARGKPVAPRPGVVTDGRGSGGRYTEILTHDIGRRHNAPAASAEQGLRRRTAQQKSDLRVENPSSPSSILQYSTSPLG